MNEGDRTAIADEAWVMAAQNARIPAYWAFSPFFALLFLFFCDVTPADSAGHSQESRLLASTGDRQQQRRQ
jgi:hypothetical protein